MMALFQLSFAWNPYTSLGGEAEDIFKFRFEQTHWYADDGIILSPEQNPIRHYFK